MEAQCKSVLDVGLMSLCRPRWSIRGLAVGSPLLSLRDATAAHMASVRVATEWIVSHDIVCSSRENRRFVRRCPLAFLRRDLLASDVLPQLEWYSRRLLPVSSLRTH
eukprot:2909508-Amphidinium_carterae.1